MGNVNVKNRTANCSFINFVFSFLSFVYIWNVCKKLTMKNKSHLFVSLFSKTVMKYFFHIFLKLFKLDWYSAFNNNIP